MKNLWVKNLVIPQVQQNSTAQKVTKEIAEHPKSIEMFDVLRMREVPSTANQLAEATNRPNKIQGMEPCGKTE
jgi:predicted CoA-binding protein